MKPLKKPLYSFDERRVLALPGDLNATLKFAVKNFIIVGNDAIDDHGFFAVALSGGTTPKKIYQELSSDIYRNELDWSKVFLFWSDERNAPPTDKDSNYSMAMEGGNLQSLPLMQENIFRMIAEDHIEENALAYEKLIKKKLENHPFDLIMLGMGDDGHTASLFPHTEALQSKDRLVVANFVPQKESWRMSFTYDLINASSHICFYVWGKAKSKMAAHVLTSPFDKETLPSQGIGTPEHPALWILDEEASEEISYLFSFKN